MDTVGHSRPLPASHLAAAEELWHGGNPAALHCCRSHSLPPKYTLHYLPEDSPDPEGALLQPAAPRGAPCELQPFPARVVSNQRLTAQAHFQDVRLIEFDIAGSGIT